MTGLDGIVDDRALPVGTLFKGWCTGAGDIGRTTSLLMDDCEYRVDIYRAATGWIERWAGTVEHDDIDEVFRPSVQRVNVATDEMCDKFLDPEYLDSRTATFEADLQAMTQRCGVDWRSVAAEPPLWSP